MWVSKCGPWKLQYSRRWLKSTLLAVEYSHEDTEEFFICPVCNTKANIGTTGCEKCNAWFHFECVELTKTDIARIKNMQYVWRACVENQLYCHDTSTDGRNTDEVEKDLTIEAACIENLQTAILIEQW